MAGNTGNNATETQRVIYSMLGVSKTINQKQILKDIYLSYFYGAKIGVLGLNGSGKSTLLKILAGVDKEFDGKVEMAPGFRIGYLEQEPLRNEKRSVEEVIREGCAEVTKLLEEYDRLNEKLCDPNLSPDDMEKTLARVGDLQEKLDLIDAWTIDSQLEMAMDALRCPPKEATCDKLSGGERRRVALCRLLLSKPDVLLLDEPTNHLDPESVYWLEQYLARYPGTVIAVTHDRYFLDNVAGWILELDRGIGIPYKGNYTGWLEQKHKRLALEEKQESVRQKTLARELDWVRQNPKGRQAKSKARVSAYEKLLSEDSEKRAKEIEIYIPPGPRLGNLVIEAKQLSKAFGDTLLLENVEFSIPPGAIVGIIGPNGAGKTTLFKMIVGLEKPDSGSFKVGETVQLAYVEQTRDSLPAGKNVWEVISEGSEEIRLGNARVNSRAYVARFGFSGSDQQKSVETLSGGERNRVHLARLLKSHANVILLDEPTNDLDVNVMRGLEEALENFAGTAVIISHDRWFLDRLATHIIAFEGDAKIHFHTGNWASYEEERRKRFGEDALQPHRLKFRRLTRS
ncbi:MAG: energy-dependent translational throttle protein EttA [Planctomycetota bacterium]|jgi:ATP-binding cassette ChvD family protein|nr:energy-dependent translational throttle protein EttA [Planctomycetota bacterium]